MIFYRGPSKVVFDRYHFTDTDTDTDTSASYRYIGRYYRPIFNSTEIVKIAYFCINTKFCAHCQVIMTSPAVEKSLSTSIVANLAFSKSGIFAFFIHIYDFIKQKYRPPISYNTDNHRPIPITAKKLNIC